MVIFPSTLFIGPDQKQIDQQIANYCQHLGNPLHVNNPDIYLIASDYSIDNIRAAKKFLCQKPYSHLSKIIIINQAENLHLEAQNALLKTIEEPGDHHYIFLSTANIGALLPTLVSRCRPVKLVAGHRQTVWLLKFPTDTKTVPNLSDKLLQTQPDLPLFLQQQLLAYHQALVHHPSPITAQIIKKIILALKMLKSNVDPRSALDYLFLSS